MEANIRQRVRGGRTRGGRGGEEVRGGEGRGEVGRGRGRGVRNTKTDEIRVTVVDHVVNHWMSMREAGQRVQPNLSRYTVAGIIWIFRNENR